MTYASLFGERAKISAVAVRIAATPQRIKGDGFETERYRMKLKHTVGARRGRYVKHTFPPTNGWPGVSVPQFGVTDPEYASAPVPGLSSVRMHGIGENPWTRAVVTRVRRISVDTQEGVILGGPTWRVEGIVEWGSYSHYDGGEQQGYLTNHRRIDGLYEVAFDAGPRRPAAIELVWQGDLHL